MSPKLSQVRVLAALTITHGVMMALYSIIYIAFGSLFPFLPAPPDQPDQPPPALMAGIFACFAATHLIPGVLQIIAGLRMLRYANRTLCYIAFASGFFSFLGCYCIPTSLALAIWGFILLSDPEVKAAFDAPDPSP